MHDIHRPTPAYAYLLSADGRECFELEAHDDCLRVRMGEVGRPCLVLLARFRTSGEAGEHRLRLIDAWQAKGYAPCEPTVPIVEGSVADEVFCDDEHPVLDAFFAIDGAGGLRGRRARLCFFRDGLRHDGDLDLERIAQLGLHHGVIVQGDVDVRGVFSQLTYCYPAYILITGDVLANSFGHGDSHMRVLGDVRVRNIVYGQYNDGSLRIDGAAHGRAFISADHSMHAAGGYHLPVLSWDSGENWDQLLPELVDEDGCLITQEILACMREGRDPLRPDPACAMRELPRPPPPPPVRSAFATRLSALVECEDTDGMVELLETWPERGGEWQAAWTGRLCAPSTTPAQRARLKALAP